MNNTIVPSTDGRDFTVLPEGGMTGPSPALDRLARDLPRIAAELEGRSDAPAEIDVDAASIVVPSRGMMVLEGVSGIASDEFWLQVLERGGWIRFTKVMSGCYQATALRLPTDPAPAPLAEARGVWWRRQAAIEAHRSICAYLEGLPPSRESASRSAP